MKTVKRLTADEDTTRDGRRLSSRSSAFGAEAMCQPAQRARDIRMSAGSCCVTVLGHPPGDHSMRKSPRHSPCAIASFSEPTTTHYDHLRNLRVRESGLSSPTAPFDNLAAPLLEPRTPGWVDAAMQHAKPINV